eukprot:PLAT4738.1.p2 GENE.PLAT4738.1~~PLAT4738.1.p2  ORF type:complete len:574 (-),score=302.24 PLAT4738.1:105-1790(-)
MSERFKTYYVEYKDDDEARAGEDALIEEMTTELWEDAAFPANGDSLYVDGTRPPRGALPADLVDWNRINQGEIEGCDTPVTFADGSSAGDVIQGQLGDCWFLGALSVVAMRESLLKKVFVSDRNRAKGIYTLKFNKDGIWRYVHIDDRIPCDRGGKPLYAKGKDPNETWVMLIEKAYAKIHGSFRALVGGYIDYGLRDMTGGAPIKLKLPKLKRDIESGKLWEDLLEFHADGSLMGASFSLGAGGHVESDRGMGILAGHAYGLLDVRAVSSGDEEFKLVRMRNPWGMREWTGDWCDNDFMWEDYPDVKRELNPGPFVNDGSFWMTFEDFTQQYNTIFVCVDLPDGWETVAYSGEWIKGDTRSGAGGAPNYPKTWAMNPQYGFSVAEETDFLIVLSQRDLLWETGSGKYTSAVGFIVAELSAGKKVVTKLSRRKMKGMSRTFAPLRSVAGRCKLPPGEYVIVPSTFKAGTETRFLLEVHTSTDVTPHLEGDELPDTMDAEESDDEEDDDGCAFDEPEEPEEEPEEEGLEIRALQTTVSDLATLIHKLKDEISGLEDRVAAVE